MSEPQPASAAQVRRIRRRLRAGQITEAEARELGFPPADPIKEKR
jgi:hypothetical protein